MKSSLLETLRSRFEKNAKRHSGIEWKDVADSLKKKAGKLRSLEEMEAKEIGKAIERAIESLRPEYRSCIMLRHVEGRSYEEIAAMLDLPLGTVKTYIHRARHQLREALGAIRD